MRVLPLLVVLLVAGLAPAQELTVAEVVAAHRAGAPEEGILRLIRESPAVAPIASADLAKLRAAGVPERVIEAMASRTTPTPTPARPDDQRLVEVVQAVNSGLSAEVVAEQVRRSGNRLRAHRQRPHLPQGEPSGGCGHRCARDERGVSHGCGRSHRHPPPCPSWCRPFRCRHRSNR